MKCLVRFTAAAFLLPVLAFASEGEPPSGAPAENCDKEITSLLAPCKPPVSIQVVTPRSEDAPALLRVCTVSATGQRTCTERSE